MAISPGMLDFARIWQAADKIVYSKSLEIVNSKSLEIVYSKSLEIVSTPKTRLEREFNPQAIRNLKTQSPHDVSVAGPNLAAQAIRAGHVDEYHFASGADDAWRRQAGPAQRRTSSLSHAGLMEAS